MTRLGVIVGVLAMVVTGCGGPKPRPAVHFESEAWRYGSTPGYKLTTEHYEIYTTLRDQVLRDALPDFVEAAFESYARLVPPAHAPTEPMKVYLFASRGQWEAFTRRFTGPRAKIFLQVRNGGYSERGVSVIEYVAHEVTFPLFAHEGFHQYLYHYVNAQIPPWLNEGLAVYCEGQRWGADRINEFDPWFNPVRRNDLTAALASNRLHSLRRLLETDAGRIIAGSQESVAAYYGELWALVLFLREGGNGKYAAGFERLLGGLSTVDMEQRARAAYIWSERGAFNFGEDLFRNFISDDLDTVEHEYFDFMRTRFFGKR
jgi:hypothetical protein